MFREYPLYFGPHRFVQVLRHQQERTGSQQADDDDAPKDELTGKADEPTQLRECPSYKTGS